VSPLSTNDRAKCGERLWIGTKRCGVVRDSMKWSEVFAKRLKEVRRRALAIGGGKRCGMIGTIVDDSFDGHGEVQRSSQDCVELRDELRA
jgi:hypothetical protein